jgi:hypothetical protein
LFLTFRLLFQIGFCLHTDDVENPACGISSPFNQIRGPGNREVYLSPDRGSKDDQTILIAKARMRVYVVAGARNARHFWIADELDMLAGEAIEKIHG